VLVVLGILTIAVTSVVLVNQDCPPGKTSVLLNNSQICLSNGEFNSTRNALASKCASGEPFANVEEFQIFIGALNAQSKKDGGIVLKNIENNLFSELCKSLIK